MEGTSRQRINEHDNIEQSYECNWQLKYQAPDKAQQDHYSIFCSMGEWNTIITDYLTDKRWDALDFDVLVRAGGVPVQFGKDQKVSFR